MNAIVLERHLPTDARPETGRSPRNVRIIPMLMMIGGVTISLVAASMSITMLRSYPRHEPPVAATVAPAHEFPEVGVSENTYQPGHTSGWHTHRGVHSAVVLAGTLTIYDAKCQRSDYHAGDSYLGGEDPHVARNEGTEPVELVVTYVYANRSPLHHATVVPAPAGCDAA